MKYLLIFCLILIGCVPKKIEIDETAYKMMIIDSAIIKSKENLSILDSTNKSTDTLISLKVKSAAKKMMDLEKQIESYNFEKKQFLTVEKVVYRVDTIYIETKKNFWGKEKTTKSLKEDSSSVIIIDSSSSESEKIDTSKSNR